MCIRIILTQVVRDVIESYEALAIIFERVYFLLHSDDTTHVRVDRVARKGLGTDSFYSRNFGKRSQGGVGARNLGIAHNAVERSRRPRS